MAAEAMLASKEPIPLRALKTQVGGHFVILEIDAEWVCKPVLAQETLFYENLPVELKKFTPKYKGSTKRSKSRPFHHFDRKA